MSVRSGAATGEEFDVLHEGVAPWLKRSLADWIHSELDLDRPSPSERRAEEIVRRLRLRLEIEPGGSTCAALVDLVIGADERSLDVIDATLNLCDQRKPGRLLEKLLVEAGSAWAVGIDGDDRQCLQRRVDPEVVNQYVAVVAERRRAAAKLQAAWAAAYGRDPSFPDAVIFAVEAVAAASPGTVETQSSPTQVLAELATTGSLVGASDNDALGQNLGGVPDLV